MVYSFFMEGRLRLCLKYLDILEKRNELKVNRKEDSELVFFAKENLKKREKLLFQIAKCI
jgi:hypothetical protein